MTFVIEDGVPTCIVEVKEEIDGRTPEDTAEQLRMMLNHQFPVPPASHASTERTTYRATGATSAKID